MEKEEAIKIVVNLAKAVQAQVRATPEEHEKLKQALELLEEKKDG